MQIPQRGTACLKSGVVAHEVHVNINDEACQQ